MSTKKQEVIDAVEEKIQEVVEAPKADAMTVFGKIDRKIVCARQAKADKKAAKAEAKAAKKTEKEKPEKKVNLKVVLPAAALGVGAGIGVLVKTIVDNRASDCEDEFIDMPAEETAEQEAPAEENPEA